MIDSDPRQRLDALIAACSPPVARPAVADGAADPAGADVQRIATAQIDELLPRIAAVTAILGGGDGSGWDDVDRLAAQLLLADLTVVTSTTRALNGLAASRLARALADLQAAGVDVQRAVKEASGS